MSRRYDGPTDVEFVGLDPYAFRWRGRRYVVREVLAHWVAADVWWRPLWSRMTERAAVNGAAVSGADAQSAVAQSAVADRGVPLRTDLAVGDRQVWRLEVECSGGTGVVDISRASDGRWVLSTVWD